jgi:hypothetical protein
VPINKYFFPFYCVSLVFVVIVISVIVIFLVANDGSKLDPILPQTMCCVICHFVCQIYNVGSPTSKRRKGVIFKVNNMGLIL